LVLLFGDIAMDGQVCGQLACRRAVVRQSNEIGDRRTAGLAAAFAGGGAAVSTGVQKRIAIWGALEAAEYAGELEKRVRAVLRDDLRQRQGGVQAPPEVLAEAVGNALRADLEPAPRGGSEFAERRKTVRAKSEDDIRDQLVEKRWKKMQREVDAWRAGRTKEPTWRLKSRQAATRFRTGWNTWHNDGIVERAKEDPAVAYLQFTLGTSRVHTDACLSREGMVVAKGSPKELVNRPPLHYGCHSSWIPITREMAKAMGIATYIPKAARKNPPADGFGLSRELVRTKTRLSKRR
jgi:hypothetical protein